MAALVAREAGFEPFELNASDTRSKKSMGQQLAGVLGTAVLNFGARSAAPQSQTLKTRVVIMDEVDGMSSGDRGGMQELIKLLKTSKTPIICICNDRQKSSVRSLANHCYDLKFVRPNKSSVAKRMREVAKLEGLSVEANALEILVESNGNDIRQVLNAMQMWRQKSKNMSFDDVRRRRSNVGKDEILRVNSFDATRCIFNESRRMPLQLRYDAFFVDYDMIPLMIHQNYPCECARRE